MRFTARHLAVTDSSVTARTGSTPSGSAAGLRDGSTAGRRGRLLGLAALGALAGLLGSCAEGDPEPAEDTGPGQSSAEESPSTTAAPSQSPPDEASAGDGTGADPDPSETPDESASPGGGEGEDQEDLLSEQGVSAAHPEAVAAGEEILDDGGNAADAAIATALAVSVVEPYASGLGGGGSTLIAGGDIDEPEFYDYREEVAGDGEIPDSGIGVPGFVAGLGELHEAHGSMDWEDLVEPARSLAADGVEVTEFLHTRMTEDLGPEAIEDEQEFAPGGDPLEVGETLVQKDLAGTLSTLADEGWETFYTGEIAAGLTEIEGLDDQTLEEYEVREGSPVSGDFGEYEVLSAAPALPGPALIQMLQDAESAGIAEAEPDSSDYVQTLSEAWLDAEETAHTVLGDPEFVDVPLNEIISSSALGTSASGAAPQNSSAQGTSAQGPSAQGLSAQGDSSVRPAGDDGSTPTPEAPNTTHISTVDSTGQAVSMTNTLTNFWGSAETTGGFFLNNQLSRFESIDSPANQPEPGKRSVTWSTPSMVLDDQERPVLAIGTPGGHQILNVLGTVLTRWGLQDSSLEEAIAAQRFRLDGETDTIFVEEEPSGELAQGIADAGWSTEVWPRDVAAFGSVQALERDYATGEIIGAEDPRREGTFAITD